MAVSKSFLATLALAGWASSINAQQFVMGKQSYDSMGLSAQCTKVLNTELAHCSSELFWRTDRTIDNVVEVLGRSQLDDICVPQCREELSALREKILQTCTAPEDVMRDSGLEFPPIYFADKFAYTFDVNCYKHKTTGRFCDEVYAEWREDKSKFDQCDDCYLGPMAIQLASPIGVSAHRAAAFNSTTEACKDTSYQFTTAMPYARPASTTTVSSQETSPRPCERSYVVKKGDTCNSIALSQNTSTFGFIQANSIGIDCAGMPKEGTKLCLDTPCDTYIIQAGDQCHAIADKFGIKSAQFKAMNPMLDSTCSNIKRWEGYVACVGPASLVPRQAPAEPMPTTPLKPLAPGSSSKCTMFVNGRAATDPDLIAIADGFMPQWLEPAHIRFLNKCNAIAEYNGVYTGDFLEMNPSLLESRAKGRKCVLEEAYSYCLAEEGGPVPKLPEGWNKAWGLRWG
ncbi:hypothetical protein GGTG_00334 [Gaeumannomyces tritici R3-111a-1]|uniref:LysM domain-containing protein n=1 Tax=Gaeumannomyces tritici (strain R3-111a-1) TaxID=644352 RepID=J3NGE3_GAET3|nr:hypothetical protein GGTG_00334 [Gaeumannomyces tritici R3-111a-1]EJT80333.1 hypothetical protein GGTG_00334 [Gaeumannomyces tritici R3-111a-1]